MRFKELGGRTEVAYWVKRRAPFNAGFKETESESPGYQRSPPITKRVGVRVEML